MNRFLIAIIFMISAFGMQSCLLTNDKSENKSFNIDWSLKLHKGGSVINYQNNSFLFSKNIEDSASLFFYNISKDGEFLPEMILNKLPTPWALRSSTSDGGFFWTNGMTTSFNYSFSKTDSKGNEIWSILSHKMRYQGNLTVPDDVYIREIIDDNDGNIFLLATLTNFGEPNISHLFKFNQLGEIEFELKLSDFITMVETHDKMGYLLGGQSRVGDPIIQRVDKSGLTYNEYHIIAGPDDRPRQGIKSIIKSKDGNYIFIGMRIPDTPLNEAYPHIRVSKMNESGEIIWEWWRPRSGDWEAFGHKLFEQNDGSFFAYGTARATFVSGSLQYLTKLNDNGQILWDSTYYPDKNQYFSHPQNAYGNGIIYYGNAQNDTTTIIKMSVK